MTVPFILSSNTAYISHSASRERLAYVFRALLPPVPEDAIILDIGSRLGAVLYGVSYSLLPYEVNSSEQTAICIFHSFLVL